MIEEAKTGATGSSVFTRRPGSSSLSIAFGEKEENSFFNGNLNLQNIANKIKKDGSVDFEFEVQAPRPFKRYSGTDDAYDHRDMRVPVDSSVDTPTVEFVRCTLDLARHPTAREDMTVLVEDGGVRKKILQEGLPLNENNEGQGGSPTTVEEGYRVWFHYEMYAEKSESLIPFDSTLKHGYASSLDIGQCTLLGLDHVLRSMRKGEIAEVCLEPEYGYGKLGIPGFIEKEQCLRVIIQLVDIAASTRKPIVFMNVMERLEADLTLGEVLEDVEKLIKAGNVKFGHNLYRDSCDRYNWALEIFRDFRGEKQSDFTPEDEAIDKKCYQLYSNLALCYNRLEDYEEVEKVCKAALALVHPDGELKPKVLFRYATAMYHLKRYEEAEALCKRGRLCHMGRVEFQDLMQKVKVGILRKKMEVEEDDQTYANEEDDSASLELDPGMVDESEEGDEEEPSYAVEVDDDSPLELKPRKRNGLEDDDGGFDLEFECDFFKHELEKRGYA